MAKKNARGSAVKKRNPRGTRAPSSAGKANESSKRDVRSRRAPYGIRKALVSIPLRLVAARLMKGWSQEEAAERIGITTPTLRPLETGEALGYVEELLVRIADVYGTSLDFLFGRTESAIERFLNARPDVQSAVLSGITGGVERLVQSRESLRYIDSLVGMAANELPDWSSLQAFRDRPDTQRMAIIQSMVQTIGRLSSDREALKYVTALIHQLFASTTANYSLAREEAALSHSLTTIDRMFGKKDEFTPSRFAVKEVQPPVKGKRTSKQARAKKPSRKK